MQDRLAFLGPLRFAPSAHSGHPEHASKEVAEVSTAATATFPESLLTIGVVDFAFLRVREDLVGHVELLELLLITTSVGMVGHCQPSVGLLDLVSCRLLVNTQQIIELLSIRSLFLATRSTTAHLFEVAEGESSTTEKHVLNLLLYCIILYFIKLSKRISSSTNILD